MKKVLFICTHNSARSQMAEGLLRAMYGDRYEALSAGTAPTRVNPFAVRVMQEVGIDISNQRAKRVEEYTGMQIDYVVTVCDQAKETCPFFPARLKNFHKSFVDPTSIEGTDEEKLEMFRRVKGDIKSWIEDTFKHQNGVRTS